MKDVQSEIDRALYGLRKHSATEADEQNTVMDALLYGCVPAFRINQGGPPDKRGVPFSALRDLGGQAMTGVADLLIMPTQCLFCRKRGLPGGREFCGCCSLIPRIIWMEMKRVRGGRQRESQIAFQHLVESWGQTYVMCCGADAALAWLRENEIL